MTAKQALKECEVFSTLTDAELDRIASSVIEKEYDAGTTIAEEGDEAVELLVLQEGKVAIQIVMPSEESETGRRITVDIVTKDEIVGWSALVEPYTYSFTAVCLQKVKALSISSTKLRMLVQDNSKIGYEVQKGLIKVIASRLEETRRVLVSERQ